MMNPQSIEPQKQLVFHEKADSFDLQIVFTGQKLTFTMKDHVNSIVYSKQYTDEDAGLEIDRRMELFDVYSAFMQTKLQRDEEIMRKKEYEEIKKYEFGTVIESVDRKLPCYKIERGGKITVYLNLVDARTNKEVTFESNLILREARIMTQTEISSLKIVRLSENELMLKVQELEQLLRVQQNLQTKIQSLTKIRSRLQKKLQQLKQQQQKKDQESTKKLTQKTTQITQIKKRLQRRTLHPKQFS